MIKVDLYTVRSSLLTSSTLPVSVGTMPCWLAVALIVATLFLAFVLCSYLGL